MPHEYVDSGHSMTRVYISGPMSNIPGFNFAAFHAADAAWTGCGYSVGNPATNFAGRTDLPRSVYLRQDIYEVLRSDAVAVLPGWQSSKGAALEVAVAEAIGLPVWDAAYPARPRPPHETVTEEAQRIVYGAREQAYGHPADDFERTGRIWAAILGIEQVTAEQVALCMIGLKISRQTNRHGRDNLVDVCGYAATIERIKQREATVVEVENPG